MTLFLTFLVLVAGGAIALAATGVHQIPPGYVGIVHRRIGRDDPRDDRNVKFLGGPGPQAKTLLANRIYIRPRLLFEVKPVPQTRIPAGTIGVVVAKAGRHAPPEQPLCHHVDCNNFQDGEAFLVNGGQQGRQPGILVEGVYDINPLLFEVLTVDTIGEGRYGLTAADLKEIVIPEGSTGVVVARVGELPDEADGVVGRRVPGHHAFQRPWAFLAHGGQRGAQEETLGRGGVYRINPWFARVILIPTRYLSLEWTHRENKPASNYDAALDQIVVNVDGHRLRFEMTQIIRIPHQAAPLLVGRFGADESDVAGGSGANPVPVQRFVERVLGSTVEGYFHGNAAGYKVLDLLQHHDEVRLELEECVRQALAEWGVEAVRTTLTAFESEDGDLDAFRRTIATARDRWQVGRHDIANAEAEVRAGRIRLELERERRRLALTELEERIRLLGIDTATMEVLLEQIGKIKGPDIVGGDPSAMLPYLPIAAAHEILNRGGRRDDPRSWRAGAGEAITGQDDSVEGTRPVRGPARPNDHAGSDRAGSDRSSRDHAGSDRGGPDHAGSDRGGPDHAGSDRGGPDR